MYYQESMSSRSKLLVPEFPLLEARQLAMSWHQKPIFQPLDLQLCQGSISAVVGPSGSGKSTLLLGLADLHHEFPGLQRHGEVVVHGRSSYVGLVLQKATPFPLSIFENVALALRQRRYSGSKLQHRVQIALEQAGLWQEVNHRLKDPATRLSGGQQQRLSIARVLALEPDILLLDEPCSALDPLSVHAMESTILDLKSRMHILLVTHNLAQARRLADHTFVFWGTPTGGRLLEQGPTQKVLENPEDPLVRTYVEAELGFAGAAKKSDLI